MTTLHSRRRNPRRLVVAVALAAAAILAINNNHLTPATAPHARANSGPHPEATSNGPASRPPLPKARPTVSTTPDTEDKRRLTVIVWWEGTVETGVAVKQALGRSAEAEPSVIYSGTTGNKQFQVDDVPFRKSYNVIVARNPGGSLHGTINCMLRQGGTVIDKHTIRNGWRGKANCSKLRRSWSPNPNSEF